ncbi:hypothetical protein GCM10028807_48910 [Spirosoma daeguense]
MNQLLNLPAPVLNVHIRKMGKITLPIADLMYLQATGNYCWLHWKDGQRLLMPRTLKYYEPQLTEDSFVRVHRNCLVNVGYIDRMQPTYADKGGLIHLRSGEILRVSRRRWVSIRRLIHRLSLPADYVQAALA